MTTRLVALLVLAMPACSIPEVTDNLALENPPPELGRPQWVRTSAAVGSWVGAVVGGVFSVALLPVTYPVSLLADEPLGRARGEFLFAPVSGAAAAGHFALGAPTDLVDYLFRRAWIDEPPPPGYEWTPARPPARPSDAETEAGGDGR